MKRPNYCHLDREQASGFVDDWSRSQVHASAEEGRGKGGYGAFVRLDVALGRSVRRHRTDQRMKCLRLLILRYLFPGVADQMHHLNRPLIEAKTRLRGQQLHGSTRTQHNSKICIWLSHRCFERTVSPVQV
jgi:hypothetical protein